MDTNSVYEVGEPLRLEFIEGFHDRLAIMETCLRSAASGARDPLDALNEFKRELHNIKGTGGAFGFPNLSLICHRFEECLLHMPTVMFGTSRVISVYVDQLKEISEAAIDPPEAALRTILRSLPLIGEFPEEGAEKGGAEDTAALEVLVVAASGTIRHKLRSELLPFGFQVTTAPDGIVALSLILRGRPDIVIVSGTVNGIEGFDLIRAVVTMKSTNKIRIAAVTSFDLEHPEVLMLPEGVPVIQLKANLKDEIARAVSALEYRFL